jgi:hypothetical protein
VSAACRSGVVDGFLFPEGNAAGEDPVFQLGVGQASVPAPGPVASRLGTLKGRSFRERLGIGPGGFFGLPAEVGQLGVGQSLDWAFPCVGEDFRGLLDELFQPPGEHGGLVVCGVEVPVPGGGAEQAGGVSGAGFGLGQVRGDGSPGFGGDEPVGVGAEDVPGHGGYADAVGFRGDIAVLIGQGQG